MEPKERKFLLKRLPILSFLQPYSIAVCYDKDTEYKGEQTNNGLVYVKRTLYSTTYITISQPDFVGEFNKSKKTLIKNRYVHNSEGIIWDIDKYSMLDLVIASTTDDIKDIPQEIKDVLLIEITDKKEFTDYMLADEFGK